MIKVKTKILSSEEQLKLLKLWQETKNSRAFTKLVESNYRLVTKIAYKYGRNNPRLESEDLIQQGLLGLSKAAEKFDLSKDVSFITYAHYWIDQSVRSYVMDNRSIVRLGTTEDGRKIFGSLSKARKEAEKVCDTQEEILDYICKELGVKRKNLIKMMNVLSSNDLSLDKKINESEEGSSTVGDMMTYEDDLTPDANKEIKERESIIDKIIEENLNETEKIIIKSRFFSEPKLTYEIIGGAVNLSRQKVKEIEGNCYKRIKNILHSEYKIRNLSEIV
jgi:RNA polymerase sigma-32 factor